MELTKVEKEWTLVREANINRVIRRIGEWTMADVLRTPQEFSGQTGVPLATVYGWNSKRTGPRYIKVGRHIRYRQADIDAWLDSHEVRPRPAA